MAIVATDVCVRASLQKITASTPPSLSQRWKGAAQALSQRDRTFTLIDLLATSRGRSKL